MDTNLIHRVVENGCFAQLLKKHVSFSRKKQKSEKQQTAINKKREPHITNVNKVLSCGAGGEGGSIDKNT